MYVLYKIPLWFSGYDAIFQILFAIITLLVAIYAFKIYKVSGENEVKLFGYAFIFITASYIAWPIVGVFASLPLNKTTIGILLENNNLATVLSVYPHVIFFLLGLTTLAYSTFKKRDRKLFVLLSALTLMPVLIAIKKTNMIYAIASVLIFFVLIHHYNNYKEKQNKKMLMTTLAFLFLFLATIDLTLSDNQHVYYASGHFLMLASYLLILVRLTINYRKWRKKETN